MNQKRPNGVGLQEQKRTSLGGMPRVQAGQQRNQETGGTQLIYLKRTERGQGETWFPMKH